MSSPAPTAYFIASEPEDCTRSLAGHGTELLDGTGRDVEGYLQLESIIPTSPQKFPGGCMSHQNRHGINSPNRVAGISYRGKPILPPADVLCTTCGQAYHRRGIPREALQHPRQTRYPRIGVFFPTLAAGIDTRQRALRRQGDARTVLGTLGPPIPFRASSVELTRPCIPKSSVCPKPPSPFPRYPFPPTEPLSPVPSSPPPPSVCSRCQPKTTTQPQPTDQPNRVAKIMRLRNGTQKAGL